MDNQEQLLKKLVPISGRVKEGPAFNVAGMDGAALAKLGVKGLADEPGSFGRKIDERNGCHLIDSIDDFDVHLVLPTLGVDVTIELHDLIIVLQFKICESDEVDGFDFVDGEGCVIDSVGSKRIH